MVRSSPGQTFTNGSFETNNFNGWLTTASPNPATTPGPAVLGAPPVPYGITPFDGSFQALVNSTGSGDSTGDVCDGGNAVTAAELNSFLSVTLPSNGNGAPQNGEAISQTFSVPPQGATVTFAYKYESRETPGNGYDETGYVLNGNFYILADTSTPGQTNPNSGAQMPWLAPYRTATITVPGGQNTLGFVAYNTGEPGNEKAPTGLYIDNVVVTPLSNTTTYTQIDPATATSAQATGVFGAYTVGSYTDGQSQIHGFFDDGTSIVAIDPPASTLTTVSGISGNNLVGFYDDSSAGDHGFFYDGGNFTFTKLDAPFPGTTNTEATAVAGTTVAGIYTDSHGEHGFVYNGSTYTSIDPTNSILTQATALSGSNVAGTYTDASLGEHGFIYDGTNYTSFDPAVGASSVVVTGISGTNVVGWYQDSGGVTHGFFYSGGVSTTIDPVSLGTTATRVTAVSGANMVGWYVDGGGVQHGFFYDGTTYTMIDPTGSQATQITALFGNSVVGLFRDGGGVQHGFRAELGSAKTAASLTLNNLFTTWDNTSKSVAWTTVPAGLNVKVTYNGSPTLPTAVGDYAVVATIDDPTFPNYQGTATATFSIGKANVNSITVSSTTATYDGTPKSVTVVVDPAVNYIVTYDGGTTPPTNARSYDVNVFVDDGTYQGSSLGHTLTINPEPATITLSNLNVTSNGSPQPVSVATTPLPLGVNISNSVTYQSNTYPISTTPPTDPGIYTVVGTITDPNYQAQPDTETLTISPAQTGTYSDWASSYSFPGAPDVATQNDGVANMLKYLYGIDPTRPMTPTDLAMLPVLGTTTIGQTEYLTLTYHQNASANDLTIVPQVSSDLQNWSTATDPNSIFPRQDPDDPTLTQYGVPLTGPHQFLRLNVSLPAQ